MAEMDFPNNPMIGQQYVNSIGIVYEWNGVVWTVNLFPAGTYAVSDLLNQVRVLLQDTDTTAAYRYSTDSIVLSLNQGMQEMFRLRPDLFLEQDFIVPRFNSSFLSEALGIEDQYVPTLVYYVVGMVQLRDDETTQDQRALAFLQTFKQTLEMVT